ncbi:MAG: hypothetical protein VKP72_02050 [bacterium]|nr:hypothetical protein [bacterium]
MNKFAVLAALSLVTSCAVSPETGPVKVVTKRTASIVGYDPTMTRLFVNFFRGDAAARRAIQALPASFASASVTLSNAATPSLLVSPLSRTVTFTATSSPQVVSAGSANFTRLRVGTHYGVNVSLYDGSNVVASGRRTGIELVAGVNTVSVIMSPNGDLAITGSNQGNTVGDSNGWFVTKGDTVTFDTGFSASEHTTYVADNPGRTLTMQVLVNDGQIDDLTSAIAGASETLVATASAPFDSFVWDTSAVSNTGFNPTSSLTDTGTQASQMIFRIVDDLGNVVGESILKPLSVGSAASLDLKLQ